MTDRGAQTSILASLVLGLGMVLSVVLLEPSAGHAQTIEDGSDAVIGKDDARIVLDLIKRHLNRPEAKVTALRRSAGSWICGSVNVKNREGIYSGERGFVVDLSARSFARVPDGPELLDPHAAGFDEMERARRLYFRLCLD